MATPSRRKTGGGSAKRLQHGLGGRGGQARDLVGGAVVDEQVAASFDHAADGERIGDRTVGLVGRPGDEERLDAPSEHSRRVVAVEQHGPQRAQRVARAVVEVQPPFVGQ